MIFRRLRKGKKGLTLVEMIVAIAVTAILAVCLSTMLVPVVNVYGTNKTKVELMDAVSSRLNDFAAQLRGAQGVYLAEAEGSFFDINTQSQYDGCRKFKVTHAIAMDNYFEKNSPKISGYRYPEMKCLDYSNVSKPEVVYASKWGEKLISDEYQEANKQIYCPNDGSNKPAFYMLVRKDAAGNATCLEMHLTMKKGDVRQEGVKTITCENLVIQGKVVYKASFVWNSSLGDFVLTPAEVSTGTNETKWKKYCSVWFSKP
ncbi:MAG: prepilin-type N-terminal cleavage/methylation domain-containing protein [Clostridia bacterium]|nr:prepilin-type N-terminal cleavage/methylation domain-containing protein [Clostridia bacterium]